MNENLQYENYIIIPTVYYLSSLRPLVLIIAKCMVENATSDTFIQYLHLDS